MALPVGLLPVLTLVGTFIARFLIIRFMLALGMFAVTNALVQRFVSFMQAKIDQQVASAGSQFAVVFQITGVLEAIGILVAAWMLFYQIKAAKYLVGMNSSGGAGT